MERILIEAINPWKPFAFRELFRYRDMFYFRVLNSYRAEHRQMVLSYLWIVIDPALKILFFSMVFGSIAKVQTGALPYVVFNASAVVLWQYLGACLNASVTSLSNDTVLVQKVYFPRIFVPVIPCIVQLPNFAVNLLLVLVLLACRGYPPTLELFWVIPLAVLSVLWAAGIGLLLSTYVVQFRDLRKIWVTAMQFMIYLAPVAYPLQAIPAAWRPLYLLNPSATLIEAFRCALLGRPLPLASLGLSAAVCLGMLYLGAVAFRRREPTIVDTI